MSNVLSSSRAKPQIVPEVAEVGAKDDVEQSEVARQKAGGKALWIIAALALAAALGAALYFHLTRGEQTTDDAMIDADIVPIAVRVAGTVERVHVKDDAHVKKGDVLVTLDAAELLARVKQAEGELAAAEAEALTAEAQEHVIEAGAKGGFSTSEAQVSASRAQVSSADAQIASARAQLARAEAEAKQAELDAEHARELYAANAVSRNRLDTLVTASGTARAAVEAATAQLAAAQDAEHVARSRVAEATGTFEANRPIDAKIAAAAGTAQMKRARVGTAQAALELARLALSYAIVRAPSDGTVSRLAVREGQSLSLGQAVASIVPERSYVVANFKETQVGAMRPGQKVSVSVDAFPGKELHGVVASLSGGTGSRFSLLPPDNASGNFVKVVQRVPVRIDWSSVPASVVLRPGMSVTVTVHTGS